MVRVDTKNARYLPPLAKFTNDPLKSTTVRRRECAQVGSRVRFIKREPVDAIQRNAPQCEGVRRSEWGRL
jgi:hypothetical protein